MLKTPLSTVLVLVACMGLLAGSAAFAQEGGSGSIVGKVLTEQGNVLPGAEVTVDGTTLTASTRTTGDFLLTPVPAGPVTISVSYLGYQTVTAELELADGQTLRHDVTMQPSFAEEVTVIGNTYLSGQEKALNQQKMAINIKNIVAADQIGRFPDPNAAEASQRIPGVTLFRDQGEGRFVQVRGTEPRLNSTMINGERIPSPEGGERNVPLDIIPADLLEAIVVSKALTPDMDGDAIGGAINLVTKRAPEQLRVSGTLGYGYNSIVEDNINQANFTYGDRYGDDKKTGFVLTGSYLETDRGSHNIEPEYDDGFLDQLEQRNYELNRRRIGVTTSLDHAVSDRSNLYFRGIFNDYDDQEFRRAKSEKVGDDAIEREIKDRLQEESINSIIVGGENLFGSKAILEYRVGYSEADQEEPDRVESVFEHEDVIFAPNVTPGRIDPNNIRANPLNEDINEFFLDEIELQNEVDKEDDLVVAVDASFPFYTGGGTAGLWKIGAKTRFKDSSVDEDVVIHELDDDLALVDVLDSWTSATPFFDGKYDIGQFQIPSAMRDLVFSGMTESEIDIESDLADFDAEEDTLAGYGLADVQLGEKNSFLGGLRYEQTDTSYVANELILDEEGDPESLRPVSASNDYGELLPMAHWRHAFDPTSNFRVAVTRTLARPNFVDLAPFQLIIREDNEIERGNPDLKVTTSWNLDVLYEKYWAPAGVFAAGIFYKDMSDPIFISTFEEERDGEDFDVIQPLNAPSANLAGIELAFQRQVWRGLGIFFNYTYTDSETDQVDRPDTRLQGQPENTGNLAITYEQGGFSGKIAGNYHDEYLLETGGEPAEDVFVDEHFQVDLSLRYRFHKRWSVFLEVVNLNEEEFRVYEGSADRTIQQELYEWWGTIGVKFDM